MRRRLFELKHVIYKLLQHVNDFRTIGYIGHFVFQYETKIVYRGVFVAIKIPCKFGEEIFIN